MNILMNARRTMPMNMITRMRRAMRMNTITRMHTHDPAEMKKIVNRLSRSIGHLESVKRMVESGQDCPDVLVQLAAVRAELAGAGKAILKQHIEHCIVDAIRDEDEEAITKMNRAIDRFMK